MAGEPRLNGYDDTPVYTIKTVVQETGIAPATLRAWERRYGVLSPGRSDGGYRLYSERDIATPSGHCETTGTSCDKYRGRGRTRTCFLRRFGCHGRLSVDLPSGRQSSRWCCRAVS